MRERGMTLIEVLVALVVLGSAVASLLALMSLHGRNGRALEENILARIVAENVLVRELAARPGEDIGTAEEASIGGVTYVAQVARIAAPFDGLEIVRVDVKAAGSDQTLATIETLTAASTSP